MSDNTDVQTTLREMWETRPARPHDGRKVAGVAAAIARRYDVDPVLIRIGFVVAAFYGVGILLYIAGWIALPDESDDAPTPSAASGRSGRHRSPHPALIVGLAIVGLITAGTVVRGEPQLLLSLAVVGGLLFLLHRHRADQGTPGRPLAASTTTDTAAAPSPAAGDPAGDGEPPADGQRAQDRPDGEPVQRTEPPAWDPLGAAPFAWDLPEPSTPAQPQVPQRRSPLTLVTLGLALLAAGIAGGILLAAGDLAGLRVVAGVVLGVVGLGLVVGAFLRQGRALILLALPLIVVSYALTAATLSGWNGIGSLGTTPTSAGAVAGRYERSVGDIQLNLRSLDLSSAGADAPPIVTTVDVGIGNAEVYLPADANVEVHCSVGIGTTDCAGLGDGRRGPSLDVRGTVGKPGGRLIILDAHAGMGNVEVHRG